MSYVVGIDPGLFGAMAVLSEAGELKLLIDMPIYHYTKGESEKYEYDIKAICKELMFFNNEYTIFLEKMQSMPPGFRVQASFGLEKCEGIFEGMLTMRKLKYELVLPKDWQKIFGITGAKGDKKSQSFQIASRLFPTAELVTPKGRKIDGRADALLIAEFGRRKLYGSVVRSS
jgi:hypothetical protein